MKPKAQKYHNEKTVIDGITFDSMKEATRYVELKLLERAGEVKELKLQPKFELQEAFRHNGKAVRAINYIADFMYYDTATDRIVVEDTKGYRTKDFEIKKKMFLKKYPQYTLIIS